MKTYWLIFHTRLRAFVGSSSAGHHGWVYDTNQAKRWESPEEAEAFAFNSVAQNPDYFGLLETVTRLFEK